MNNSMTKSWITQSIWEIAPFFERHELRKLTQEEIGALNGPLDNEEIE